MKKTIILFKWKGMTAILVSIILCVTVGCSSILSEDVEIVGKVKLSDNPASGHGGIEVSNGHLKTTSIDDGSYILEGEILGDASFRVTFSKDGYNSKYIDVTVDYASDGNNPTDSDTDAYVDLGTVTLTKLDK